MIQHIRELRDFKLLIIIRWVTNSCVGVTGIESQRSHLLALGSCHSWLRNLLLLSNLNWGRCRNRWHWDMTNALILPLLIYLLVFSPLSVRLLSFLFFVILFLTIFNVCLKISENVERESVQFELKHATWVVFLAKFFDNLDDSILLGLLETTDWLLQSFFLGRCHRSILVLLLFKHFRFWFAMRRVSREGLTYSTGQLFRESLNLRSYLSNLVILLFCFALSWWSFPLLLGLGQVKELVWKDRHFSNLRDNFGELWDFCSQGLISSKADNSRQKIGHNSRQNLLGPLEVFVYVYLDCGDYVINVLQFCWTLMLLEELHQRTIFDLADEIIRDSESLFVSLTTLLTLN